MPPVPHRKALFDAVKRELTVNIKLDIARTVRQHPHLTGESERRAYEKLAANASVEQLIRDLAREEAEEAVNRGDLPPAGIIHLAGYLQNQSGEG